MQKLLHCFLAFFAVATTMPSALAQGFPNKPIRFIIGFAPGNNLDLDTRAIAGEMQKRMGQTVLVENRPGANATIAAKYVAGSPPDGYTLISGTATSFHPLFNANNAVYAGTELSPVSHVSAVPYFLYIGGKFPVKNAEELVAYSKTQPGGMTAGHTSATIEFLQQMLRDRSGFVSRNIPYKAQPNVVTALLSGELDTVFSSGVGPFRPHIQSGAIRPLFVTSAKRLAVAPDVPTAAEVGLQNFEAYANNAVWAPLKTPREIIQKLSSEIALAVRVPAVSQQISMTSGGEPIGSTPEELQRVVEAETKLWTEAARKAGFKAQ